MSVPSTREIREPGAPDVVVVGGGVIGLAVAWRASREGMKVAVVDARPARGASWAAAGMLAPVTEVHPGEELLLALNLAAAARWPAWVEELTHDSGLEPGYRQTGTLVVARDADENEALEDLFDFQKGLGLQATRLRSRDCRSLEPLLSPRVRGGINVEGDHQVDNRALMSGLMEACTRNGVAFVRSNAAAILGDDRVEGVELVGGEVIEVTSVVVAAGTWSGLIEMPRAFTLDLRPVKGQLLILRGSQSPPLLQRTVRGRDVYLVPRDDGRVIVGASSEEMGFDTSVRAGAVFDLLRDAYELVPGITELELSEICVGLRPATPDNAPVLGPSNIEGLYLATGHYRNGILLAPVTADALVASLTGGEPPLEAVPFSPDRFRRAETVT
jgi:glycine oxidase